MNKPIFGRQKRSKSMSRVERKRCVSCSSYTFCQKKRNQRKRRKREFHFHSIFALGIAIHIPKTHFESWKSKHIGMETFYKYSEVIFILYPNRVNKVSRSHIKYMVKKENLVLSQTQKNNEKEIIVYITFYAVATAFYSQENEAKREKRFIRGVEIHIHFIYTVSVCNNDNKSINTHRILSTRTHAHSAYLCVYKPPGKKNIITHIPHK